MKIYQAVKKMMEFCDISVGALSQASGISRSRISQFINGYFLEKKADGKAHCGADLSSSALDILLEAAIKLHPDAKKFFCSFLCDGDLSDPSYESMDEDKLAEQLLMIGKVWKLRSRKLSENPDSQALITIA